LLTLGTHTHKVYMSVVPVDKFTGTQNALQVFSVGYWQASIRFATISQNDHIIELPQ
jgi:hypothetical protein